MDYKIKVGDTFAYQGDPYTLITRTKYIAIYGDKGSHEGCSRINGVSGIDTIIWEPSPSFDWEAEEI